jgi:hypothetical protein
VKPAPFRGVLSAPTVATSHSIDRLEATMGPKATILPVGLAAIALVAGCGDDDNDADSEGLSRSDYIARSGAICESTAQKAEVAFKRIVGKEGPPPPGEEQAFLVKAQRFLAEGAIPIIRENVDRRRELPAPAGDEGEIEAIIAAGEKALVGFDDVASDPAKTRALFEGKLADPAKQFDALSRKYGIDKCGGDEEQ